MARVAIEKLSKIFKGPKGQGVQAVKDVTLTVEDKEFLVLVGPSGCGKSTTLRLIAGLEEVTQGTITIDGRVINQVPPQERDIAMVFQNYALYPHMTVYENLAFGLKLRKFARPEIEKRVREAAEMLGLSPCLARYPKALSGGERQRVALGRAIVRKPRVFLFDEPLSNLDAPLRAQLRVEISALQKRLETTMIYVTHDQAEAMALGNRVAIMKDGTLQQVAAPMEVYDRPANLFVAGFIGSPGMNFFEGTILHKEDGLYFAGPMRSGSPGELRLRLHEETAQRFGSHAGRNVILGLRPEHILVPRRQGEQDQTLTATVELIEPTGAETLVHLAGGTHRFVARFPGRDTAELHGKLSVGFDMSKAHFFDPATGLAFS